MKNHLPILHVHKFFKDSTNLSGKLDWLFSLDFGHSPNSFILTGSSTLWFFFCNKLAHISWKDQINSVHK